MIRAPRYLLLEDILARLLGCSLAGQLNNLWVFLQGVFPIGLVGLSVGHKPYPLRVRSCALVSPDPCPILDPGFPEQHAYARCTHSADFGQQGPRVTGTRTGPSEWRNSLQEGLSLPPVMTPRQQIADHPHSHLLLDQALVL